MSEQKPRLPILVFARSYEVFRYWMRRNELDPHDSRHVRYISDQRQVYGVRNPQVVLLPGYADHPIWSADFVWLLRSRNHNGEVKYLDPVDAARLLKNPPEVLHVKQCEECIRLVKELAALMKEKGWAGTARENEGFIEESVQRDLTLRG